MNCAYLGLGVMGFPMAGHLADAGNTLVVFNRNKFKAERWVDKYEGEFALSPSEAVAEAKVVLACVGNDLDSLAVGQEAIASMRPGSIYVDHTTTSATCAHTLAEFATDRDVGFVDAPVSGGEAGAQNGTLSIMCGGKEQDLHIVKPIFEAYSNRIVHIGPVGHGQLCKSVNQIAIAGLLQGLSEAVHFAKSADIDTSKVFEAISGGAAQSWQMENRWHTMVEGNFDFGFAVEWMRKDLGIVFSEGDRFDANLPVTRLVDTFYDDVMKSGGRRWDTSSLVTRLEK